MGIFFITNRHGTVRAVKSCGLVMLEYGRVCGLAYNNYQLLTLVKLYAVI